MGKEVVRDERGRVVSGNLNPNGRPRVRSWTDALRRELDRPCSDEPQAVKVCGELGLDPKSLSVGELIIRRRALLALGLEGSPFGWMQNISDMHDRIDGKPTQRVEVSNDGTMSEAINGKADDLRQAFAEIDGAAETPALPDGGGSGADLAGN